MLCVLANGILARLLMRLEQQQVCLLGAEECCCYHGNHVWWCLLSVCWLRLVHASHLWSSSCRLAIQLRHYLRIRISSVVSISLWRPQAQQLVCALQFNATCGCAAATLLATAFVLCCLACTLNCIGSLDTDCFLCHAWRFPCFPAELLFECNPSSPAFTAVD